MSGWFALGQNLVLCIDDRALTLEVRKLVLEHDGYEVLTASDGEHGLQLFTSHPVDLVVLDYDMGDTKGATVAQRMRVVKPEVPLIMVSGHFEAPRDAVDFIDAYVNKGENPRVLLQRVRQLLARKSAGERGTRA